MADPRYGAGGEGFDETLARMNEVSAARDELRRKEEARRGAEERAEQAGRKNVGVRGDVAGATDKLSSSLSRSIDLLNAETRAIEANTAALQRRVSVLGAGGVATAPRAAAAPRVAAEPAPFIGPVESPQRAQARYNDALRAQAAAEIGQRQARTEVTSAQRKGTSPEELAPLLERREAANQAVAEARGHARALQANIQAVQQATASQNEARAAQRAENQRLAVAQREHAAAEREAAAAAQERAAAERRAASEHQRAVITGGRQLGVGQGPLALGPGRSVAVAGPPTNVLENARRSFAVTSGGTAIPQIGRGHADELSATEQLANRNAVALTRVAGAQGDVNRMVQQSIAQYGASSQALQRHGALTSEFIQAFARGEVTLQEFQSQMLTTMGKFGGWALAGAAVYGVVDALKRLGDGAKEAQSGYIQLTRFIPNVNQGQATHTFSNISTDLNVPMKEVVDTMTIMARTFKTLPEAATATRAALLVSRLDQIKPEQSAPQLVGISQAFGLNAKGTLGVVDSLNALQREYGARVSQTLPGLARAAPAALAAGVDQHTLEALIGVGVRGGLTGTQVATAVARSATTFVQKPAQQELLEAHGFNPNQPYGELIKSISSYIGERNKQGQAVSGKELRDLAVGLAGPQLGARTFATILARGGDINKFAETAAHPGETAEHERQKQLGSVSEQFKSIGIGLENFGANLSASGILIPLQALLSVIHQMSQAAGTLLSPFAAIGNALGQLPGPLKEILGAAALYAVGQRGYRSTFGQTATGALGKIPGLSFLDSPDREAVRQLSQTQNVGYDFAKRQQEQSAYRAATAAQERQRATADVLNFRESDAAVERKSPAERAAYEQQLGKYTQKEEQATRAAADAQAAYLTDLQTTRDFQAKIAVYKSKELSDAQKIAFGVATGAAGTPFGAPTTNPVRTAIRATDEELARNKQLSADALSAAYIEQARRGKFDESPPVGGGGTTEGGVALPPGVRDPVREQLDSERLQAEANRPGFIEGRLQGIAGRLQDRGTFGAGLGAGAIEEVAGSRLVGAGDFGIRNAGVIGQGLVGGVPSALASAFGGIMAAQLVNATVPGKAGDFLGSAITGGALGLGGASLLNNVLKQYGVTNQIGGASAFAIGTGVDLLGSKNAGANILGGALAGGGIGQLLGRTPQGFVLGAALTAGVKLDEAINPIPQPSEQLQKEGAPTFRPSNFLGVKGASDIWDVLNPFAANPTTYEEQRQAFHKRIQTFQAQQAQLGSVSGSALSDDSIKAFGETFAQQLDDQFGKKGDDAKKAAAQINSKISLLTAQLQTFGSGTQAGQNAVALLREAASKSVEQAGKDPEHLDAALSSAEKATQALNQDAQRELQQAEARAQSGNDRAAAVQAYIASQQANIQAIYTDPAREAGQRADDLSKRYTELLAKRGTAAFGGASGTKKLNDLGKQITQQQGAQQALSQAGAQAAAANLPAQQQAQADAYSHIQADIAASTGVAQAAAGADTLKSLQAQLSGAQQELGATGVLSLDPEQQANQQKQIQAKIIQAQQARAKEQVTRAQSLEKVQEANVPLNLPTANADKVLADARADLSRMEKAKGAFSPEEINQQKVNVIQAQRQRAQLGLTNVQAQSELAQSQVPAYDPVAVAQGQLRGAERAADYMKANASNFNFADIVRAMAAVNNARQAVADAMHQQQAQMSQAQGEIAKAHDVGDSVAQAQDDTNTALRALQAARTPLERAQAQAQVLNAQNAKYQAVTQRADQGFQIQQVNATGDAAQQAAIERARALFDLSRARGPDEAQAAALELAQANVAAHQAQQQRIAALGSLQEAQAAGSPRRQAEIAVRTAQAELANAHGIDERIAAETKLAQAEQQQSGSRIQLIAQLAQLHETQATGDSVRQAQIALRAGRDELAAARTPEQERAARQAIASAQVQLHQARQQRITAGGGLAEARAAGNQVEQAQIAVATARRELAGARGLDERIAAETQLAQAEYQLHQARQSRLQSLGGLQQAQFQGDPLAVAAVAVQTAQAMLAGARGVDEQIAAQTALANAQYQYRQAVNQMIQAVTGLAASGTRDPIQKLASQIRGAELELQNAKTAYEKIQAQTNLQDLQNQYQDALLSQGQSTIDFQLQMRAITTQQAIDGLRKLLALAGNVQEQQQLLLKIRQLQMGATGTGGQFDLMPGNIKLPTIYDVQRAIRGSNGITDSGATLAATVANNIVVNVANSGDVPAVADAIDRATSSSLRAKLRNAGVIGG